MKARGSRVVVTERTSRMDCRDVERLAELSLDGEIDGKEQADLEVHLARCPACSRMVGARKWYQVQVRAKLQASTDEQPVPANLKNRIAATIQHEDKTTKSFPWRRAATVSVAACAILVGTWSSTGEATLDPEEPVSRHAKNLPPEVRARGSEREVRQFFEKTLNYHVAVPRPTRPTSNVRLVGARLSNIDNRDAAYVMYDQRGARISLFAYPKPHRFAMPSGFEERVVHGQHLRIGRHRGYNLVSWSSGQMVYALVSDVDADELVELAVSTER